ncbi:MAG: IS66 family transposase [Bdellovibrionales bacterium]|nr:IS66 family transposase [Bdellovibrionales bacterium]
MLFEYDVSGGGQVAERLLGDFKGAVQSDAHKGYNRLSGVLRLGCWMHVRRKYHEAFTAAKKGNGLASDALDYIKELYRLEKLYKEQQLSNDERKVARQRDQTKLLDDFKLWAEGNYSKVPPSSSIGVATKYQLDEWERLTNYLKDGRYEIDNGEVERTIRKFAIGRNNWLFCDTPEGAHASSLLYSLMITAKLNKKDPYQAMVNILTELPTAQTIEDFEKLTEYLLK